MEMEKLEEAVGAGYSRVDCSDSTEPPFFHYINKTVVLLRSRWRRVCLLLTDCAF